MERFGLVGLPNAGKSSLYNALTGGGALAAPYPFATKDPNIGVAKVPDDRLDRLAAMSKSKNVVHAAVEVVDIGGLDLRDPFEVAFPDVDDGEHAPVGQ